MADRLSDGRQYDDSGTSVLDAATNLVTRTSIPVPVRKNSFKALVRLYSTLVNIPVASLEGKSSEIFAEYESSIKIISATSEQITEQMRVDPEYGRAAAKEFGQRIIREQVNLDMILK